MRASLWTAIATLAFVTLVVTGTLPVGVPGQWTYGLFSADIPPRMGNIPVAALGAAALIGVVTLGLHRSAEARAAERIAHVAALGLCALVVLVGQVLVSRAGAAEPAWINTLEHSGGFFKDALRLKDVPRPLADYGTHAPRLSIHGRWHPPGPVAIHLAALRWFERHDGTARELLLRAERAEALPPPLAPRALPSADAAAALVVAWFILIASATTVVPIYLLGVEIGSRAIGLAAAGLYSVVPALAFFEGMMDLVYPVFTAWALWFICRGFKTEAPSRRALWWLAAGVTLGLGLFFSYCQLAVLPVAALWGLCEVRRRGPASFGPMLLHGLAIVAGIGVALLAIRSVTGYNAVSDFFSRGIGRSWDWGSKLGGAPTNRPYAIWIFANLLEYVAFAGIPIVVGAAWAAMTGARGLWRGGATLADGAAVAFVAGLLLLDATGVNRSETARLWIFLTPLAAVAAASRFSTPRWAPAALIGAAWFQSLLFKLTLSTGNVIN
jgi:hypothetical protein